MTLSQDNINKLHIKGLYKSSAYTLDNDENKYAIGNWTFNVVIQDDKHYMKCPTIGTLIELTDDNFDNFTIMIKDVESELSELQNNNSVWI